MENNPKRKNRWKHVLVYDKSLLPEGMSMTDVILNYKTHAVVEYETGMMDSSHEKQPPYILSLNDEELEFIDSRKIDEQQESD